VDGLHEPLVPLLLADLRQGRGAELLLVSLGSPGRVVAELEILNEPSVDEKGGTETGSERDHELDASSADDLQPLHVGVVGGAHGFAQRLGEKAIDLLAHP